MKVRVSEVFRSFQGEGVFTGALSIWVRFFGCNLNCNGFMQENPCDPSTHVLPYQTIDLSSIKKMEDLPVFDYGCDSGYSWSERYKHLAQDYTEETIAEKIVSLLPQGKWENPNTGNFFDLAFTGGEPMMQQKQMIAVMKQLKFLEEVDRPIRVQIETNGTKPILPAFAEFLTELRLNGIDTVFNISPKLFNVAGEKDEDAWKPEVIASYAEAGSSNTNLKFVVNNTEAAWAELNRKVKELRDSGYNLPVFIMPVGATKEQQEDSAVVSQIANRAIAEGYHVSGRVHATVFGNGIGT